MPHGPGLLAAGCPCPRAAWMIFSGPSSMRVDHVDEGGVDGVLGGVDHRDGRAVVGVALVLELGASASSIGQLPSKGR